MSDNPRKEAETLIPIHNATKPIKRKKKKTMVWNVVGILTFTLLVLFVITGGIFIWNGGSHKLLKFSSNTQKSTISPINSFDDHSSPISSSTQLYEPVDVQYSMNEVFMTENDVSRNTITPYYNTGDVIDTMENTHNNNDLHGTSSTIITVSSLLISTITSNSYEDFTTQGFTEISQDQEINTEHPPSVTDSTASNEVTHIEEEEYTFVEESVKSDGEDVMNSKNIPPNILIMTTETSKYQEEVPENITQQFQEIQGKSDTVNSYTPLVETSTTQYTFKHTEAEETAVETKTTGKYGQHNAVDNVDSLNNLKNDTEILNTNEKYEFESDAESTDAEEEDFSYELVTPTNYHPITVRPIYRPVVVPPVIVQEYTPPICNPINPISSTNNHPDIIPPVIIQEYVPPSYNPSNAGSSTNNHPGIIPPIIIQEYAPPSYNPSNAGSSTNNHPDIIPPVIIQEYVPSSYNSYNYGPSINNHPGIIPSFVVQDGDFVEYSTQDATKQDFTPPVVIAPNLLQNNIPSVFKQQDILNPVQNPSAIIPPVYFIQDGPQLLHHRKSPVHDDTNNGTLEINNDDNK